MQNYLKSQSFLKNNQKDNNNNNIKRDCSVLLFLNSCTKKAYDTGVECYRYSNSSAWWRASRSEWLDIRQKGMLCCGDKHTVSLSLKRVIRNIFAEHSFTESATKIWSILKVGYSSQQLFIPENTVRDPSTRPHIEKINNNNILWYII